MKQLTVIIALAMGTACSSSGEKGDESQQEVTSETSQKLIEAQQVNTELEELDGQLDSLLNSLD
jgi:uncharacterized protein YcfL